MGKTSLGNGVFVDVQDDRLILTTEDGLRTTNTIALEPEVFRELRDYYARAVEAAIHAGLDEALHRPGEDG
jgi:hypothetical protein